MSAPGLRCTFTSRANRELAAITQKLRDEAGVETAQRFLDALDHTTELISRYPRLGFPCRFASSEWRDERRIPISGKFSLWLIFYAIAPGQIRVDRVLHGAQDWFSEFE